MATPLSATGRIQIQYQVDAVFTHKLFCYVRNPQLVGSVWQINSRTTDANDTFWGDAAEGMQETLSYILGGSPTFGQSVLQHLVGGAWQPVDTHGFARTNHASGSVANGYQMTLVLRDKLFNQVKVVVLDHNSAGLGHSTSITVGGTAIENFNKQFTSGNTVAIAPYTWMVGRADQFLATNPVISWTVATNRKVRRARGLT